MILVMGSKMLPKSHCMLKAKNLSFIFLEEAFSNSCEFELQIWQIFNFWNRPLIWLSKVTSGIYRSSLISLRGQKNRNTLWKYKKYSLRCKFDQFSIVRNFWKIPLIWLSKVTSGIYTSSLIFAVGQKNRNTLWKYKKYTQIQFEMQIWPIFNTMQIK